MSTKKNMLFLPTFCQVSVINKIVIAILKVNKSYDTNYKSELDTTLFIISRY